VDVQLFPLTPFMTNCYVVRSAGEAIVIDPGETVPALLAALEGCRVRAIINTHAHCDHCAGNALLLQETGSELMLHEEDLPLLRAIQQQGLMFGFNAMPSPDPHVFLEAEDEVRVGDLVFEVRHAPGHTPGHIVLVGPGRVFSGDVLFRGSIGRSDLPGGNHQQLLRSIQTQLLSLPDDTVVYSGHGPATTIGEERATNPFLAGL
jgi:glyoxylase-like metal-dependent hydrolase (beta-lactamase superfamily II)